MKLTTERLTIRPLGEEDIPAFVAYRRDPNVARFQSWTPDYSSEQARNLVASQPAGVPPVGVPPAGGWLQLAMLHDGRLVGDLAVHTLEDQPASYEVGVTVGERRRGFAAEGMRALIDHLFARGAHRVVAFSDARNVAVAALLTKVGFRHESRAVDADWFKGEWTTLDGWAILSTEWAASGGDVGGRG